MELRISAPGKNLSPEEIERIHTDLDKIARRLDAHREVTAELRVSGNKSTPEYHVTLEVDYGRNHLIATDDGSDLGQTIREAREDIMRQINDRSRGSHSDYAKKNG